MDEATLEKFAGNVTYEIKMVKCTAQKLAQLGQGFERNAFLESFLTHVRNLYEFFEDSPKQKDVVSKYYAGSSWKTGPDFPVMCHINNAVKRKIHKLLAHLTLEREEYADANDTSWEVEKMTVDITKVWAYFLSKLPETKQLWFTKWL